jgi:hypothetical protein
MRDGGDDCRLLVCPAEALDAGLLADRRARAVRRDQKLARDLAFAVRSRCDGDPRSCFEFGNRKRQMSSTPIWLCARRQRAISGGFSTMCANGSPGCDLRRRT